MDLPALGKRLLVGLKWPGRLALRLLVPLHESSLRAQLREEREQVQSLRHQLELAREDGKVKDVSIKGLMDLVAHYETRWRAMTAIQARRIAAATEGRKD